MKSDSKAFIVSDRFYELMREANDYYNAKAGFTIAVKFMEAVEAGLARIEENPYSGTRYNSPTSYAAMKDLHYRQLNLANNSAFPYTIYYEVEAHSIIIHVIYHHSRNRDRLLHS